MCLKFKSRVCCSEKFLQFGKWLGKHRCLFCPWMVTYSNHIFDTRTGCRLSSGLLHLWQEPTIHGVYRKKSLLESWVPPYCRSVYVHISYHGCSLQFYSEGLCFLSEALMVNESFDGMSRPPTPCCSRFTLDASSVTWRCGSLLNQDLPSGALGRMPLLVWLPGHEGALQVTFYGNLNHNSNTGTNHGPAEC